jgi:glycerophosphoryl diester phosphodiesterase
MSVRPSPAWALPRVFAHRCAGALAPEATLAGLPIAAALGFRAVEFDVMLSADGSPWVIHDEQLERTTNGHGLVCAATDAQLAGLDAGGYQHRAFSGEPLPTFAAVAGRCRELGLMANVEIKPAAGYEAQTGEVVGRRITELWQGVPWPLVSSFSEVALAAARRVAPQLPLGCLCARPSADWLARLAAVDGYSLHCAAEAIDDALLDAAAGAGVPLLCWTVNDPAQARSLLARGVTSVFSDRIDLLLGV